MTELFLLMSAALAWQSPAAPALAAGRLASIPALRSETGKPFSATVTAQTAQTFLDGTHVSQTTTMLEYRDAEGRVRTETPQRGSAHVVIVIRDPVAGITYRLSPSTKTAVKASISTAPAPIARPAVHTSRLVEHGEVTEDLGTTTISGVVARGTRVTTTVPAGAIGNDREFRTIDERWFSSELNLLIRSVNTDPRFGTTTYELTNINRQPPEPALFQVPSDYTIAQ